MLDKAVTTAAAIKEIKVTGIDWRKPKKKSRAGKKRKASSAEDDDDDVDDAGWHRVEYTVFIK